MLIVGHRGARGEAPENTLGGFRHLASLGVRAVEFDIQLSGDRIPVVIHDDRVDRTTQAHGPLADFDAGALAALDTAHHRLYPDPATPGRDIPWPRPEGIPPLSDVLTLLADFSHLQLEVKSRRPEDCERLLEILPALWRPFGRRATVTSFNQDFLTLIGHRHPEIPRGLLMETDGDADTMISRAVALGCRLLGPHFSLCTPERVREAHALGLHVTTWTVNSPEDMLRMRDIGVDSLITDVPSLALKILDPRQAGPE